MSLPRRRFDPYSLATIPLRPAGHAAQGAANAMQSTAPMVAEVGDRAVDAAAPAIQSAATTVGEGLRTGGTAAATSLGSAASAIPYAGPVLGPAITTGGTALANMIPAMMNAAAVPATKLAGRLSFDAAQQLLKGGARMAGVKSPFGRATGTAMGMRSLMSTTPPNGLGGPTVPEGPGNAPPDMRDPGSFQPEISQDGDQKAMNVYQDAMEGVRGMFSGGGSQAPKPEIPQTTGAEDAGPMQDPDDFTRKQDAILHRGPLRPRFGRPGVI